MNDLNNKLENINARIALACARAGRSTHEISVLAVSKGQSAAKIRRLHAAGQAAFGENYVQEALAKQAQLRDLDLEWHYIGPIQSNKTGEIARHFQWVQSVGRDKILRRLSRQRPGDLPALNICLQVNIDYEEQKSGALPEDIPQLVNLALSLPNLRLRGLMAIPRAVLAAGDSVPGFLRLNELFCRLRADGLDIDTLSMGMSEDFEQAIQAGSTMVRVGTALFGPRNRESETSITAENWDGKC